MQVAHEELQDLKGVWAELSKIWEQIDELKEKPWLSVQPRKVGTTWHMGRISQLNLNMFLKKTGPIKLSLTMYLSLYFYETKFFSKLGELYNLFFFALFYRVY